ncbi:winged helix-turn-helix transcriptional regulator [Albibacterium bauzanense]
MQLSFKRTRTGYSELRNRLVGISARVLISKIKELEKDGLVNRIVYP